MASEMCTLSLIARHPASPESPPTGKNGQFFAAGDDSSPCYRGMRANLNVVIDQNQKPSDYLDFNFFSFLSTRSEISIFLLK